MDLDPEQMFVISDRPSAEHAAQIAASADLVPDLIFEVGHRHCGDLKCTRPDGPVKISLTWLDGGQDELQYKAFIHNEGHQACRQTVVRAKRKIDELLDERRRKDDHV